MLSNSVRADLRWDAEDEWDDDLSTETWWVPPFAGAQDADPAAVLSFQEDFAFLSQCNDKLSPWQFAHYYAAKCYLLRDRPAPESTLQQKISRYLEGFYYFVQVRDWPRAIHLYTHIPPELEHHFPLYSWLEVAGYYEEAIAWGQQILDRVSNTLLCVVLQSLGNAYWAIGQYERAQTHYQELLDRARDVGDSESEMLACSGLAEVCFAEDRHREALPYYQTQLELAEQLHDDLNCAKALAGLANCYDFLKRNGARDNTLGRISTTRAQECLQRARELSLSDRSHPEWLYVLRKIGLYFLTYGDFVNAIPFLQQHLALAVQFEHAYEIAAALNNIVGFDINLLSQQQHNVSFGNFTIEIVRCLDPLYSLSARIDNLDGKIEQLLALERDRKREANVYFLHIYILIVDMIIMQEKNFPISKVSGLANNISTHLLSLGDYRQALSWLERGLREALIPRERCYLCMHLSHAYAFLAEDRKAIEYAQAAAVIASELQNRELRALTKATFANVHWRRGNYAYGLYLFFCSQVIFPPWTNANARYAFGLGVHEIMAGVFRMVDSLIARLRSLVGGKK